MIDVTMGITAAKSFPHPDFKIFWRSLVRSPEGLAIKRNLEKDRNIPQPVAEEFTARIAGLVGKGLGGRPKEAMELAVMAKPELTLAGRSPDLGTDHELLRWELLSDINKSLTRLSGGSSQDLTALRNDLQAGVFTVLDGVKIQNRWGITWCTKAAEMDKGISKGYTVARIRDMLGLSHFCWGTVIEFRYSESYAPNLRIPTTLDAFDSADFRPCKLSDTTGFARDIRTKRRGLPEMVHEGRTYSEMKAHVSVRGDI